MPQTGPEIVNVKPGDPVLAADWNTLANQMRALSEIGGGSHVIATGAGIFVRSPLKGRNRVRLGKANEDISGRSEGEVSVYRGEYGSEIDTEKDIDAFNPTDTDITSGDWVRIRKTEHGIEILPMECPA